MTTVTNVESPTLASQSRQLKEAIDDLIQECSVQISDELHQAYDELLEYHFPSEDGKLKVINKLQGLNGKFVVKIIRKGLSSLGKVYTDSEKFEEECLKVVDLCCSQWDALQSSSQEGKQVASPSIIVDWTVELCEGLLSSQEGSQQSIAIKSLSSLLLKISTVYEALTNARLETTLENQDGRNNTADPFKKLFEALKARIHFGLFDELLDQAISIIKTDELLDPKKLSKLYTKKGAILLERWISLLNLSFVSNWLAVELAKHDFLINDHGFVQSQSFSDERTYSESLICVVSGELNDLVNSDKDFKLQCDPIRLQVFFNHSEVLLRYPSFCLELLQSEVTSVQIQEVLDLLQIKRDSSLLPVINETDAQELEAVFQKFQQSLHSPNPKKLDELLSKDHRYFDQAADGRHHQRAICAVVFKALIGLPDREQLVEVLRLWRHRFSSDDPYSRLFAIAGLVAHIQGGGIHNGMRKLKMFLSQFSAELLDASLNWLPIVGSLIETLPNIWDSHGFNLISDITQKVNESKDTSGATSFKVHLINKFVKSLLDIKGSEHIKAKAIEIGLDMFEYAVQPREYELVLNVISFVVSDMSTKHIRKYVSNLLKAVRDVKMHYAYIWNIIRLVHTSNSIAKKEEILHCFLKILQDGINNDDIEIKISICASFLHFPVDSSNTKQFLEYLALNRTICESVVNFLVLNEIILSSAPEHINKHIRFLLRLTGSSTKEHLYWLGQTVGSNSQWLLYKSIETFEVIIASIAGSLAVGSFRKRTIDQVLRLLHSAIHTHHLSAPNDIFSLYIVLTKSLRKVSFLGDDESRTKRFVEGINLITMLPIPFVQLKSFIHNMATVVEEGRFSEEEVTNIMFHLFKMPSSIVSTLVDPIALASQLDSLILPSVVEKLSKMHLHRRLPISYEKPVNESENGLTWLMELILKKVPTAFEDGCAVNLFTFMVEQFSEKNTTFLTISLPMIDATVKKSAGVETFKAKTKGITEKLDYIPNELAPLVAECIPEFYAMGMEEKQDIYIFIGVLLNLNWNLFDTGKLNGSLIPLNIPKHVVSVFKEKRTLKDLEEKLNRILDFTSKLSPSILSTMFILHRSKASNGNIQEFLRHDLLMLLNHTCLGSEDICYALLLYNNFQVIEVLSVSLKKLAVTHLEEDNDWPAKYDQTKLLTPGKLAYHIIHHLRRIGIDDVRTATNDICIKLLENYSKGCPGLCTTRQLSNNFEEYFELIISIMEASSNLDEIRYWLKFSAHRALQCKSVILAACYWKADSRSFEDAIQMNDKVYETLLELLNQPLVLSAKVSCFTSLKTELDTMADIIKKTEDEQIVCKLFNLLRLSVHSAAACLEIMQSWRKSECLLLIEQMEGFYVRDPDSTLEETHRDLSVTLQILPFAAKALSHSATELVSFLTEMTEKNGGYEDKMSLGRIPVWYKQMTDAGYPPQVIQSWCTSLIFWKYLSSSEVDAITNVTPEMIKFLSIETDEIGKCLFSKDAPETWQTDDYKMHRKNTESFKRCLLLARLVNEFFYIGHQLKDNPEVFQRIKDRTQALCGIFAEETSSLGKMYKSRDSLLHELFVLLFSGENGKDNKFITQLMSQQLLSKSFVLLFRRLARSVQRRPTTFESVKSIVNKIQKCCSEKLDPISDPTRQYSEVQGIIQNEVLRLDKNQACMHLLEVSGYNQGTSEKENLWYSPSIKMSAYVPTIESIEKFRLGRLLRQHWGEWRTILSEHKIHEVEVGENRIKVTEMFNYSDSLEVMESQLEAVKKAARLLPKDDWSSYRTRELVRKERGERANIRRQAEQVSMEGAGQMKLTKTMVVWENRLLETIKTCSEKIPGCYAPNGFHSEKPVICGLAVDNRILTLYKQDDGGSRTEMENVEVKLYPAGMVVFGLFCNSHPYDTEQMWAAFYKMLLDKHLVPKIFLTNVSPGFDWIKQFVKPEISCPSRNFSFVSSCDLIPSSEDSFDYDPDICIHRLNTLLAHSGMKELIILTKEKAQKVQISNINAPVANRKLLIKENMYEVRSHIENKSKLQEMNPESRDKILGRLKSAIRNALEIFVDGGEPTEKSISSGIRRRKLLFGCQDGQQYRKKDYAAIILDAVRTVTGSLQGGNRSYDGCEHVEFL